MQETPKRRRGVYRWYVLGIIVLSVLIFYTDWIFPGLEAKLPHIQLPAEPLFSITPGFAMTNTMVAILLADAILLLIAFGVKRATQGGELVPKGFSGAIEALLEAIHNLTESTAGKWTKTVFPFFATITLLVLIVNWMELIPGVDSIGIFNEHHVHDVAACDFRSFLGMELVFGGGEDCTAAVVPFVRVASTDLNFTVALALISVIWTQIIGVRALGPGYFRKYWNTAGIFSKPFLGVIDFGVGLLEIVSEISKILSFSFRLFGNIFAGSVLLFVIGSLVPVFAQSIFLLLEFFVGIIQAVVFGMLTMVFMSQATESHTGDEHH